MVSRWLLLLALLPGVCAWFYGRAEPDAWTQGGVWPLPQNLQYGRENRSLSPGRISYTAGTHADCDVIKDNIARYSGKWLLPFPVSPSMASAAYSVVIRVTAACPSGVPQQDMDESYLLKVENDKATLEASQVWGAIRGLETFSQLIYFDENEKTYKLRTGVIHDFPRFAVRGVMLDSSRHFLSVKMLKRQLDIMSANKLNYLHWHLVDSESFPFQSTRFPQLSEKGAYSRRHVYSPADVRDVVQYARMRGIRVVPEFDTPGHTGAWKGLPGLLPDCFDNSGRPYLKNALDPTLESTYTFLRGLFEEIHSAFPDRFVHLGADEVLYTVNNCWKNNPKIAEYMRKHGMGTSTRLLEDYYLERLQQIIRNISSSTEMVFWNEVFDNNLAVADPKAIIHLWEGDTIIDMHDAIRRITSAGHRVIVSTCWYLNYIKYGADWKSRIDLQPDVKYRYYYCDPTDFDGTPAQKKLVLGGVAAIWGEFIDNTNLESIFWPRASAVAERLWSDAAQTRDADVAWPRLHELRCRLVARGFRVSPNNFPDFCPYEFDD